MKIPASILVFLLIQQSTALQEESYENLDSYNSDPEDPQLYSAFSRPVRNDGFLRFGRNHFSEEEFNEIPKYSENLLRPTRSEGLEKNDLFVRFGRNKDDIFSRLGITPTQINPLNQHRSTRQNSEFLRFGRSVTNQKPKDIDNSRVKRENVIPESLKRKDNFLRFGRNSNFMRFGRNEIRNKLPHYLPKNRLNAMSLAKILKNLEYERYLRNQNILNL